jgi:hypothetical protein
MLFELGCRICDTPPQCPHRRRRGRDGAAVFAVGSGVSGHPTALSRGHPMALNRASREMASSLPERQAPVIAWKQ